MEDQTKPARVLLHRILGNATFAGAEELRSQIAGASVSGGPVTMFDLAVTGTRSSRPDGPIPIRVLVLGRGDTPNGELLVWVTDGYLSALEYAWYTDQSPERLPHPEDLAINPTSADIGDSDLPQRGRGGVHEMVRAVVRGEWPLDALAEVGVRLDFGNDGFRADVPAGLAVEIPLSDLARGLLATWARGTEVRRWAFAMLAIDADIDGIDSADGATLLDGLWSASAGEALSEESLEVARRLAE